MIIAIIGRQYLIGERPTDRTHRGYILALFARPEFLQNRASLAFAPRGSDRSWRRAVETLVTSSKNIPRRFFPRFSSHPRILTRRVAALYDGFREAGAGRCISSVKSEAVVQRVFERSERFRRGKRPPGEVVHSANVFFRPNVSFLKSNTFLRSERCP